MGYDGSVIQQAFLTRGVLHIFVSGYPEIQMFKKGLNYYLFFDATKKIVVRDSRLQVVVIHYPDGEKATIFEKNTSQYRYEKDVENLSDERNGVVSVLSSIFKFTVKLFVVVFIFALIAIPALQQYNDYIHDPTMQDQDFLSLFLQKPTENISQLFELSPTKAEEFQGNPTNVKEVSADPIQNTVNNQDMSEQNSDIEDVDVASKDPVNPEFEKYCSRLISKYGDRYDVSIIKIPVIEVCTTVKTGDPNKIMKSGAFFDPEYGTMNLASSEPIVISAHRFGYTNWSAEFKKHNSFADIDKLQVGDRIYIYRSNLKYIYKVTGSDINEGVIPGDVDLALYSCVGWKEKDRYFVYAKSFQTSF